MCVHSKHTISYEIVHINIIHIYIHADFASVASIPTNTYAPTLPGIFFCFASSPRAD